MRRTQALLLLLATLTAAVHAMPAQADSAPPSAPSVYTSADVGFNLGHFGPDVDRRLDGIANFLPGTSPVVRIGLNWWYVEPCRGCPLSWDRLDAQVNAAVARGMRVLLILAYAPPWANGHDTTVWFPTNDNDWASIIDRALQRYGTKVQAFEVWNEPNHIGVFGNYDTDPRARYWQLVRIAYERVHAACPTCTVVAGGSARGVMTPDDDPGKAPSQWLQWAYANGYGGFFDAVALHPYSDWDGPAKPQCARPWENLFGPPDQSVPCGELARVRSVMVSNGDGAKKIWATEIGYPAVAGSVTVQQARYNMLLSVRMWRMLSYTGPYIVYTYQDPCADSADSQCPFGVVTTSFQPKEPLFTDLSVALRHSSTLATGQRMQSGDAPLRSVDGRYALTLQSDGNLVLSRNDGVTLWSTRTTSGSRLTNQDDGNLVLRTADGTPLWSSGTWAGGPSHLFLQNDGNLVLRRNSDLQPTWSSGTASLRPTQVLQPGDAPLYSSNMQFRLTMQTDGNLVLYRSDGVPLWATGTSAVFRLNNQNDGNLVLYRRNGTPVWSTGTWAHGPSTLVVQNDGNVVLRRNSDMVVTWASNTYG